MGKTHRQTVAIDEWLDERIRHILEDEPADEAECFGEKEPAITVTARFDDGREVDVKCCGVRYEEGGSNVGWTEAVLFDGSGCELCCSEVGEAFTGEWALEADGDTYVVDVVVDG